MAITARRNSGFFQPEKQSDVPVNKGDNLSIAKASTVIGAGSNAFNQLASMRLKGAEMTEYAEATARGGVKAAFASLVKQMPQDTPSIRPMSK